MLMTKVFTEIPDEIVDTVMKYEEGSLNDNEIIDLFQLLINTGLAMQFQGKYERIAKELVIAGICFNKEERIQAYG